MTGLTPTKLNSAIKKLRHASSLVAEVRSLCRADVEVAARLDAHVEGLRAEAKLLDSMRRLRKP